MDAMKDFLIRWLVLTVAAAVMVVLLPGMTAVGQPPILGIAVFALFMALINASIKPVTQLIALPFSILTFGLLYLVINWLFMRLASWLAISLFGVGVLVHGFWWAVLGSLIMPLSRGSSAASCAIERRRTSGMMVGFRASHDCLAASRRRSRPLRFRRPHTVLGYAPKSRR